MPASLKPASSAVRYPFVFALSVALLSPLSCSKSETPEPEEQKTSARAHEKVIYGVDNRHEVFEEQDPAVRRVADSTVALIKTLAISSSASGLTITGNTFGKSYHLCADEPYFAQETPAFCSGFLVAPDTIVTAGHCISNARDCSEVSFVFNYAYQAAGVAPKTVSADNVYRCASVFHSQAPSKGADFAIIKLDRSVSNHEPLKMRANGSVAIGDEMTVIGHPTGLPTKIADGAKVRDASTSGYFVANLDTYGGNSGSAVFNSKTLEVEGVLVRGEVDFGMQPGGCMTSNRCAEDSCRGEDVTRISDVQALLSSKLVRKTVNP